MPENMLPLPHAARGGLPVIADDKFQDARLGPRAQVAQVCWRDNQFETELLLPDWMKLEFDSRRLLSVPTIIHRRNAQGR